LDIYIHGHGVWQPQGGYITVPSRFKISFYTHFAKTLSGSTVYKFMDGHNIQPERTIDEFKSVPNMVVQPLGNADQERTARQKSAAAGMQLFMPDKELDLRRIFSGFTNQFGVGQQKANANRRLNGLPAQFVHFHWLCCQKLDMPRPTAFGRAVGVNAQDMRHNDERGEVYRISVGGRDEFIPIPGHHT
jgi:hypothetical protein